MKRTHRRLVLLVIIGLAFGLRFYGLNNYPALNADEAAIGYNAYSLIETGMDEHGNGWPVHFQSFNDFKPGMYFYMVLPFVKLLGLSVWAVRIPGALMGVMTVWVVYLLVVEMFRDKKHALLAAGLLAVSPWHIHFSRGGWEVNVGTFLMSLGLWLFLKAQKNVKYYAWSVLAFAASLYTYHAVRVVIPLLGLGLLVIFGKKMWQKWKTIAVSVVLGGVLVLPLVNDMFGPEVVSRAAGVGIFADKGTLSRIEEQRGEHGDYMGVVPRVMHNKLTNYGLVFAQNWSEHFWGEFLFLSGDDIQRNKVPETGQMYMVEIVFVLAAIFAIARKPKGWGVVLWWLAVAPVAAAMTFQSPHALRAHNMVVPLTIISSFGIVKLTGSGKKWIVFVLVLAMAWSFVRYQKMYWQHMAKEYAFSSQYGVSELVEYVQGVEENYENIVVTNRYDQPYILFLFYMKYPPKMFQAEHVLTERDEFGFSTVESFGKYWFGEVNYDEVRAKYTNSLIVGTDEEIPERAGVVKEIYGSNGHKYFEAIENK